ncbi:MAG: hypothetical protein U0869_21350 [Chloroflexota bacterium]
MNPLPMSRSLVPVALAGAAALLLSGCSLLEPRLPIVMRTTPALASCGVLTVAPDASGTVDPETLDATVAVIRDRLDALELTDATADAIGPDQIAVGLPSGDDASRRATLERTGRLEVVGIPPAFLGQVVEGAPLPAGMADEPIIDNSDILTASRSEDQLGKPAVALVMDADAAVAFDDFAAAHYQEQIAMVLDGVVVSAPVLQSDHFAGQVLINGSFTEDEVRSLVVALSSGPLPTGVTETSWTAAEDGTCPLP